MRILAIALACSTVVACSSGTTSSQTQSDCDAIANAIRDAASKRGINSTGVCTSTDPMTQKDFAKACADLKACTADGG